MKYFGSSGIRGVFGSEVTLELGTRVGRALGRMRKRLVFGRDPRTSSQALDLAVTAGALEQGAQVHDCGLVATPTLAYATREHDAGVMITASHNPGEYNGIKLWNPDGSPFSSEEMEEVEKLMDRKLKGVDFPELSGPVPLEGAAAAHVSRILDDFPDAGAGATVAVDCAHGAGGTVTPLLLRKLGAKVHALGANPDGAFPSRDPEPLSKHLGPLVALVRETRARLGIAHDGDADRCVAVDERGRVLSGDQTIGVLARALGARKIVVPVDCSLSVRDSLKGCEVLLTRVGDVFVSDLVKRSGADFGGEPSGTFVFPKIGFHPDAMYATALLTKLAAERSLGALADEAPTYPLERFSLPFPGDRVEAMGSVKDAMRALEFQKIDETDGFRMEFNEGWALVRPSGTEPKVRVTVEARDTDSLQFLIGKVRPRVEAALRVAKQAEAAAPRRRR
jgi:phosphoglucosamine mutase